MNIDAVTLSVFSSRIAAVGDEMGATLKRSAFSPNIRDRLDYSCAVFDAQGRLCAQAAHIPVHLGSMAYAMGAVVAGRSWHEGDMIVLNDPYLGGTHLPDVTVIAPIFSDARLVAFVVNRAHHADIGGETPGSMPLSQRLEQEGIVIAPTLLVENGRLIEKTLSMIAARTGNAAITRGDFAAQVSANHVGAMRLGILIGQLGIDGFNQRLDALNDYADRLARDSLKEIPDGDYQFEDFMDDDGAGTEDIRICARVSVRGDSVVVDFNGTADQVPGNLNCPIPVVAAGVYYVFRCLMPAAAPNCDGLFRSIELRVPEGCLLNARRPAAVTAGNVETSTRVVDVICGALAQALPELIPAASQGTMNNLGMGDRKGARAWDYYETIAGGTGAGASGGGLSATHSHMTNTRNTSIEVLEANFPLRVTRYEIRENSGGEGARPGGNGLIREYQFLADTSVSLLTERRRYRPWGLGGGGAGLSGQNRLDGELLPAKIVFRATVGQRLRIDTPGGGAFGNGGQCPLPLSAEPS